MAECTDTNTFPYSPSGLEEVNKMIQEHGDLFSDSQCKVCKAVLISESQKLTHYQSKKHANKVRRHFSVQNEEVPVKKQKTKQTVSQDCNNGESDRMKACHLCNMTFTSPVMAESHYQGKNHAKKLKLKAADSQVPEASQTPQSVPKPAPADNTGSAAATDGQNDPDRFCSTCEANFNNPLMAQQHYAGKKHKKRVTRLKLMETYKPTTTPASSLSGYPCNICNIVLNSVEQYQSHISGARHKNQLKKTGNKKAAEDQTPAEKAQGPDEQYTPADDEYAHGNDQYAPAGDDYAPADDPDAALDEQYDAGDGQFAANDHYTPEFSEFSEQYQYT